MAADAGLGIVFAAGLAFTAYMLMDSWGGNSWLFNCLVGVALSLAALARRIDRLWTTAVGLGVAALAILVSSLAELPQEPGPVAALALAVLVGSAIRTLSAGRAGTIAAAGIAVVTGAWLSGGLTSVTLFHTVSLVAAVAVGLRLRLLDIQLDAAHNPR
ncbi:metal transporter [Phytoactinopolyspora sp. XMNu-373]|uniref:Metal transporter n=1 Tax=Phytoactinopolyspora mesophila TaxID=2650750 RepID=A0A7K3LY34_9ACTN|nr:metal transporter [Phytoactinopolyspora mesophila]